MKYRTKLFYAFCILALVSNLLALFITYGETRRTVYKLLQENIYSIVSTTSVFLNGDVIETYQDPSAMQTQSYQQLKSSLRKVRDLNRKYALYVQYIYVVIKSPQDPSKFIILLDADENVEGTQFGYPFDDVDNVAVHLNQPYIPMNFSMDQWGSYLSGYSPIYNSQGQWVATVGIDVNSSLILSYLNTILKNGIIALAISLCIAILLAFFLSKLVTTSIGHVCTIVEKIGQGDLSSRIFLHTKDEFYDLSMAINNMAKGLQERERLKLGFARYVSHYVLEKILQSEKPTKLEGERRRVTILFSDIRHFTTLAEKLSPEKVVGILNDYFEKMIEAIFQFHGTLDKFIGDGMMVEFGAPLEDDWQEKHAVEAAILMQLELKKLNEKWEKAGGTPLKSGIGIHTGPAILGNIGSEKRMEYTAIGDAVNTASRLEQLTKTIKKDIIISQPVYEAVKEVFNCESLGKTKLPGKTEEIEIYSIIIDDKAIAETYSEDILKELPKKEDEQSRDPGKK